MAAALVLAPMTCPAFRVASRQRQQQRSTGPPGWRCRRWLSRGSSSIRAGMYVPSDSFGGQSPERRASRSLITFMTFVAAKVVMSQLEGIGRGDLGAYNAEAATTLRRFLQEPMRDGSEWLENLTRENEMLGVRIMEVRAAYCQQDFEWDQLKRLTMEGVEKDNTRILRQHASQRFAPLLEKAGDGKEGQ